MLQFTVFRAVGEYMGSNANKGRRNHPITYLYRFPARDAWASSVTKRSLRSRVKRPARVSPDNPIYSSVARKAVNSNINITIFNDPTNVKRGLANDKSYQA